VREYQYTIYYIIPSSLLLRIRNVSDKFVEKYETHISVFSSLSPTPLDPTPTPTPSPENRVVYEIMWKNIVQPDRPQMTIWRMRIACWITKATNIHSEYVMLIFFHFNNGCMDAIGYVAHTLSVLLYFALFSVSEVLVVET